MVMMIRAVSRHKTGNTTSLDPTRCNSAWRLPHNETAMTAVLHSHPLFSLKPVQQGIASARTKSARQGIFWYIVHLVLALPDLSCSVLHCPRQPIPKAASTSMPSHLAGVQTGDDLTVLLGSLPRLHFVLVPNVGIPQYDEYRIHSDTRHPYMS